MNSEKECRTANRRLAKVAVQCSADTFVVNQSLILRINIYGENRHLRQAPKRYLQPKKMTDNMKGIFFFLFLLIALSSNAQNNTEREKMIIGKWKYNTASDSPAEVDTADFYKPLNERKIRVFLSELKIKKRTAKLTDFPEKLNATWEIKNKDELYFFLENKKILKYIIIKLNDDTLELREPDATISTLEYFKK
jgi:hypothetical protein